MSYFYSAEKHISLDMEFTLIIRQYYRRPAIADTSKDLWDTGYYFPMFRNDDLRASHNTGNIKQVFALCKLAIPEVNYTGTQDCGDFTTPKITCNQLLFACTEENYFIYMLFPFSFKVFFSDESKPCLRIKLMPRMMRITGHRSKKLIWWSLMIQKNAPSAIKMNAAEKFRVKILMTPTTIRRDSQRHKKSGILISNMSRLSSRKIIPAMINVNPSIILLLFLSIFWILSAYSQITDLFFIIESNWK